MKFSPLKLGKAHIGIQGLIKEPWRLEKLGPRAEDLMYLPIPSTKQSSSWDDSLYTTAINIKKKQHKLQKSPSNEIYDTKDQHDARPWLYSKIHLSIHDDKNLPNN